MVKLERIIERNAENLESHFTGIDKSYLEGKYYHSFTTKRNTKSSQNIYRKALPNLRIESQNKCCYCESDLQSMQNGVNNAEVEHFRPQGTYWWLCYSYLNLALSCHACNFNKKDKFETLGKRHPFPILRIRNLYFQPKIKWIGFAQDPAILYPKHILYLFYKLKYRLWHSKEKPKLVFPYIENPRKYFRYQIHEKKSDWFVYIQPIKLKGTTFQKAQYTIDVFDLNRKELLRNRGTALKDYFYLYKRISNSSWKIKKDKLKSLNEKYLRKDQIFWECSYTFQNILKTYFTRYWSE